MCTGMEIALLTASVGGTIASTQQQKKMLGAQADQANADADAAAGAARVKANKIREQGKKQAAAARAALAAAGVNVDLGTSVLINDDINSQSEKDALLGIDNAKDAASRLRNQATLLNMEGSAAQTAGIVNATSTVLSAGVQSKWRKDNPGSASKPIGVV